MKRLKPIYVPGFISLLGLPILYLLFLNSTLKTIPPASKPIKLFLPRDQPDPPNTIGFSKYSFLNTIKNKKVLEIDLGEPLDSNGAFIMQRKYAFISREIEDLQFLHDTTTVLQIDFGNTNTYGDFMRILGQARTYHLRTYAYIDNHFFLVPTPRPTPPAEPEIVELDL